jgi:hypothetical protein
VYKIIQCRTTASGERCNTLNETNRIKEARGLQKMQFNSHLEMLYNHEMYESWHEWEVNESDFTFRAFDIDYNLVYAYRVIIEETE